MADFFEDLGTAPASSRKPFFAIAKDASDDTLLDWFKEEIAYLKQENMHSHEKIKHNFQRYKGMQYREQVVTDRDRGPERVIKYMPQMVVPMIRDVVDEKVARLMQQKPSIAVIPLHDEQQDKADARIAKRFLSHIDTQEKTDIIFTKCLQGAKVAGEYFSVILWNPDKGPKVKVAEMLKKTGEGDTVGFIPNIGDIDIRLKSPLEYMYEKARRYEDANYSFMIEWEYTEGLKLDYPQLAEKIREDQYASYYDFETMEEKTLVGKTMTVTFFHKATKYLPEGYEAKFTRDVILKRGPMLYNDKEIPAVRWVDQVNPEEQAATSQIDYTKSMAAAYNNLTNMTIKQLSLCAHPKWFVDKYSVDDQDLNNDTSIVRIKPGSPRPALAQANPVAPNTFNFRKELKEEFYQQSKSSSVVQGSPPPGVSAFVALQFVSEQESTRLSTDQIYMGQSVKDLYKLCLSRAAQFYKKEDERTLMILGKDERWTVESYDPAVLAGPYALMLQNQSALPDSKAVRTQLVLDMGDKYPEMFPREQIIEMLGLAQADKFFNEAAASALSAENENENIFDGQAPSEPMAWENHLVHWKIHFGAIQDPGFKSKADPKVRQNMLDHLMATEMLMFEQINKSDAFAAMVNTQCPQFPVLFNPPPEPPPPLGMMPPQDQLPGPSGPEAMAGDKGLQDLSLGEIPPENQNELNPDLAQSEMIAMN